MVRMATLSFLPSMKSIRSKRGASPPLRRGATADLSPAFQGRDQIEDSSRRVATIEKTAGFSRRYATRN